MFGAQATATTACPALVAMPLLTELDSSMDGFCYRHGAPSGAMPPGLRLIPPRTAENLERHCKCLIINDLPDPHGSPSISPPNPHHTPTIHPPYTHHTPTIHPCPR